MSIRRLLAALATALLAAPLLATPAHADGSHDCFFGERSQDGAEYALTAWGCSGSGYFDVTVTIRSGAAAGGHTCRTALPWNSSLSATGCQPS
ncbi:hypothetical protein [Nonomuraea sp. NPDC049141]|uniref:hypothetical protein n=1 Tax=Nonomuraea sp. NPDC049141 TaxID=3155500 RepID=UPI003409B292